MPPKADKQLQERILKAAQRLWKTRGEHGLTLRAVAREAGTTTPTVYKRFRSKQAIQIAIGATFSGTIERSSFRNTHDRRFEQNVSTIRGRKSARVPTALLNLDRCFSSGNAPPRSFLADGTVGEAIWGQTRGLQPRLLRAVSADPRGRKPAFRARG